jgi:hypothetical protein
MGSVKGKHHSNLWENGAYFDSECLKDNELHLFAHFQKKNSVTPALPTSVVSTATSFSRPSIQAHPISVEHASAAIALDDLELTYSALER